jgi:uroporphyrinogen decarboxylase
MAPFYMYTNIRGIEQTLIDLAADEKLADYIIAKICDFLYDYHQRLFEAGNGRIDIAEVTDDFGMQTGLMISTAMFDKYFKRHYQRLIKLVKDYNIRVFHHDDGAIMPIIPRLVEVGIQVLNPIQWHLPGMDLQELKKRFGMDLCFHGGIDNQYVLPFGSVEDVKKEVMTCLDVLGKDGTGYILAPCHNVQSITPIENIVSMYETANQYSIYK